MLYCYISIYQYTSNNNMYIYTYSYSLLAIPYCPLAHKAHKLEGTAVDRVSGISRFNAPVIPKKGSLAIHPKTGTTGE